MHDRELITTAQASRILGCTPDNVRRLRREFKLKPAMFVGFGGQALFDRLEVEMLARDRAARGDSGEAA